MIPKFIQKQLHFASKLSRPRQRFGYSKFRKFARRARGYTGQAPGANLALSRL